jgi:hypothetical protein
MKPGPPTMADKTGRRNDNFCDSAPLNTCLRAGGFCNNFVSLCLRPGGKAFSLPCLRRKTSVTERIRQQQLQSSRQTLAIADTCIKSSQRLFKNRPSGEIAHRRQDTERVVHISDSRNEAEGGAAQRRSGLLERFLQRGVRTTQPWEREEALPVHRHKHQKRGTVLPVLPRFGTTKQLRSSVLLSGHSGRTSDTLQPCRSVRLRTINSND